MNVDRRNSADDTSTWQEFLLRHTDYNLLNIAEESLLYHGNKLLQLASRAAFRAGNHADSRRWQPVHHLLDNILDGQDLRNHNYHLLDLIALICIPGWPRCRSYPLVQYCATGQLQNVLVNLTRTTN